MLAVGVGIGMAAGFPLGWISKPTRFTIEPAARTPMTDAEKRFMSDQWKGVVDSADEAQKRIDAANKR